MFSDLFHRNPRLTVLALGFVIVAGLGALNSLGRQEDPTLTQRFANINSFFPGASAERVEALITEKIEEELQEIPEIKEITSLSRAGVALVEVELEESVYDVDEIWSEVRDKLADAALQFPPGAADPDLDVPPNAARTMIVGLTWALDEDPDYLILTRLAEELENRFITLPGTEDTATHGEASEEIRVTIEPERLAAAGLTAQAVSRAIALADAKAPAGQLRGERTDLLLELSGELTSLDRIRSIPLAESPDGRFLRLGDVARVEKARIDPPAALAIIRDKRGVMVAATMEANLRVDLWAERARAMVAEFQDEVPRGVDVEIIFDQSRFTDERLGSLVLNLLAGAGIVVLVLLVMMGWRSALLVASALPLTLLMVMVGLQFTDIVLHQISITGLIVALGLLIDNAIVVVDDYNAERAKGLSAGGAVRKAVGHLFIPLFASTATTALAFAPIALSPGATGEFIGGIGVSVILSVVSSFILAMTLIPALAGYLLKPVEGGRTSMLSTGISIPPLTYLYRRLLDAVIRVPALGIAISVALPIFGFFAATTLTQQFFPPVDRAQFQIQLNLPPQSSLEATERAVYRAQEVFEEFDEILDSYWVIGEAQPRVYYNTFVDADGVSSYAGAWVNTTSEKDTNRVLPKLQARIKEAIPHAEVLTLPFEQGPPFPAPVELKILGPDVNTLRQLGEQIRAVLATADKVTFTKATLTGGAPKLVLDTDEEAAGLAGFELVSLAGQISAILDGVTGGSILEGTEELPVRVQLDRATRGDLSAALSESLRPDGGFLPGAQPTDGLQGVPIDALGTPTLKPETAGIARLNGERVNNIYGYLVPFTLPASVVSDFEKRLADSDIVLPPGYRIAVGGEAEERAESVGNLLALVGPLVILMTAIVVLSFNNFAFAGVVFFTGFMSVGLAFFGVWLFGYPMGFTSIIGTLGLVGLSINGTIVVLSNLKADPAAMAGDKTAMREITVESTRHIISTTLTTIGGFIPLILFGGTFWPPFATAIAGGVAGSAVLALIMTPSWFAILRKAGRAKPVGEPDDPALTQERLNPAAGASQ